MKKYILTLPILFFSMLVSAQTTDELAAAYINKYSHLAVESMKEYGIPASVTMAQGILESGYGRGRLAVEANNHFCIKCKSTWTGKKIYHDDDELQECFRVYDSAEDSYRDHAEFLTSGARYAFLFDYGPFDYESWAHGLKKAGYATNPKYATLLLGIIERYNLQELDKGNEKEVIDALNRRLQAQKEAEMEAKRKSEVKNSLPPAVSTGQPVYVHSGMKVYRNNKSDYVIGTSGDTYASLAAKLGIPARRIARFNDVKNANAKAQGVVYISRKSTRGPKGKTHHTVKSGETLYSISQKYAIKYKWLCNLNDKRPGAPVKVGEKVRLR